MRGESFYSSTDHPASRVLLRIIHTSLSCSSCSFTSLVLVCHCLFPPAALFLYPIWLVLPLVFLLCRLAWGHRRFPRPYTVWEPLRKMSNARPLTRSVSRPFRSAGAGAAKNDHANAVHAPSNTLAMEPHGGFGRRRHCDEIIIGLALGSPGQSPLPPLPSDDRDLIADVYDVDNSPENTTSTFEDVSEINADRKGIKRKGSKWKSLRKLLGRRESRSPSPFYQLDQKKQTGPARQVMTQDDLETNTLRGKRSHSSHGNKARRADSSTSMPGRDLLRKNSSRRRGLRRKKVEALQPDTPRSPAKYTVNNKAENLDPRQDLQRSLTPRPSFLQVEIPCVELERYSVMFGDVLEPHIRQSKPQTSLLARRKGHLEEVHAVAGSYCEVCSPFTRRERLISSQLLCSHLILICQKPLFEPTQCHLSPPGLHRSHFSLRLLFPPAVP